MSAEVEKSKNIEENRKKPQNVKGSQNSGIWAKKWKKWKEVIKFERHRKKTKR